MMTRPPSANAHRIEPIDALRALALLAVVVVNFSGYDEVFNGGVLPSPQDEDGALVWAVSVLVLALLQGKGIALLTFLFGYSLTLGGFAPGRLNRLLGLGLLHGFLLYLGDIVSQYALAGWWLTRWRHWRCGRILRRARLWLIVGIVLSLGSVPYMGAPAAAVPDAGPTLADWAEPTAWWFENASGYLSYLVAMLTVGWPWTIGLVAFGLLAGRLRLLSHRRWRPMMARAARWALPMLLLQWVWAAWTAESQLVDHAGWSMTLHSLFGAAAMLTWVPWLILHVRRWPTLLVLAGRQTLTPYLLCSFVTVALWCNWAVGWRPGVLEGYAAGALLWFALMMLSAWATRRGQRLPAEAWLAKR